MQVALSTVLPSVQPAQALLLLWRGVLSAGLRVFTLEDRSATSGSQAARFLYEADYQPPRQPAGSRVRRLREFRYSPLLKGSFPTGWTLQFLTHIVLPVVLQAYQTRRKTSQSLLSFW